jgi:N-acetylglucosaminyldiphosphoundecaprenol N-acetyl-beta-D-mannosaminyltransferase
MHRQTYAILGIPIDNLTMEETIERILSMIQNYPKTLHPHYVSTVNLDFMANIHCWNPSRIRYRELYEIIVNSNLTTADGMPLVWLSRLLGNPLKERVTGADLLIQLIEVLARHKKSVFFLGGTDKINQEVAERFQKQYPDLRVTGRANPLIYVDGEGIEDSVERDALLIEQINQSKPDVLFINLGNPKQEIWFSRVRHRLKVPVSVGIGGAFSFATNAIPRAPRHMQQLGLEWLYRLYQEPTRLFKRYFIDSLKFSYMALPLLITQFFNIVCSFNRSSVDDSAGAFRLFLSHDKAIVVLLVPKVLNEEACEYLQVQIEDAFIHDSIIFDFRKTREIDLRGIAFLINTWNRAKKEKKQICGWGISQNLELFLKIHRSWSVLSDQMCSSLNQLIDKLKIDTLFHSIQQSFNAVELSFLGRLDNHLDYSSYVQKFAPILHNKDCLLNLSYCPFADNRSFQFLLNLRKDVMKDGKSLKISGLNASLMQELRLAKLDHLFQIKETNTY